MGDAKVSCAAKRQFLPDSRTVLVANRQSRPVDGRCDCVRRSGSAAAPYECVFLARKRDIIHELRRKAVERFLCSWSHYGVAYLPLDGYRHGGSRLRVHGQLGPGASALLVLAGECDIHSEKNIFEITYLR